MRFHYSFVHLFVLFLLLVLSQRDTTGAYFQRGTAEHVNQAGNPHTTVPAFEVASIRRNKSGMRFAKMEFTSDGFVATNMSLQNILVLAYDLRDPTLMGRAIPGAQVTRIPGAPDWLPVDQYDIQAKVLDSDLQQLRKLSEEHQLAMKRLMLQTLLADRFKLRVHFELKQVPAYELVLAKGGPRNMKKDAETTDTNWDFQATRRSFTAESMADFAAHLTDWIESPVIDKTGLKGKYTFTVEWTPDPQPTDGGASPLYAPGPYIVRALPDELDLKLERTTAPMKRIVIDHVERPSEN